MPTIAEALTEIVRRAADAAGHADAPVPLDPCVPTNDPRHGDYQSNFAFKLGRELRTNPRQLAQAVVDALPDNDLIEAAEVAGPGFINLRLSSAFLARDVTARGADERLGASQPGAGKTLVIDYSSPNIAKRMHVGHMRSTVIGNALDRLHRFLGYTVVADNHVGDWGTQFGKLIVAWHGWRDQERYDEDPIGELQRIYQEFGARAKVDPELLERARQETVKLQEGDPENRALWKQFVDVSMQEFDAIYERMGVRFDRTHGESHYRDDLQPLIDRLLAQGIAVENEGAVIVPFTDDDGKGLSNSPLLIRKSDGAALYGTTDLATIERRERELDPDTVAYVTDVRQQLHFRQVFAAARKMGIRDIELVHVWFGMLRFADGAVASTRAGQTVNLVDLLDTAVARARAVVDEKSGHVPEEERAAIAEAVGIGAVKYADLSQNPQSDITFDWDRMLSLEGNTAPYLMYAYARCKSLLRRAAADGLEPGAIRIEHPLERELALTIARTVEIVPAAAGTWRPNLLCDHLYSLASVFASFWAQCRVVDADPDVARSRLGLTVATAQALGRGLDLLGITPLDRM